MDLEEPGPTSLPGLKVLRLKGNRESGHVVMGSMCHVSDFPSASYLDRECFSLS